jgi:intracellular septation protein A
MHALALMILQSQADIERAQQLVPVFIAGFLIFMVAAALIIIIPFWFICKKAGMSPWLSLLWIVPFGGLILCYVLAFAEWSVVPAPQIGYMPPPSYPPPQPPQA